MRVKKAFFIAVWFMFLTFPILVIRVNPIEKLVEWRWKNMALVGCASFVLALVGRPLLARKHIRKRKADLGEVLSRLAELLEHPSRFSLSVLLVVGIPVLSFPFFFSIYQTNIMTTALIYVVLGLGLNIVVGLAGLLDLGYVAFYAVGAYSYALLNYHFDLGFWAALPLGAGFAAIFGILLGFPILRLRGDYLAIVTLGFGQIIRLILENWNDFSFGPSGIANIPRPGLFGMELSLSAATFYMYYLMVGFTVLTVFVVRRLKDSRIGRAWIALREDEIACQAMGIDLGRTKLTAFALGAFWAGMMGVVFAAKTTFINPASFTFMESAMILAIVVMGGMGSIAGVIVSALILILLPEYLRAFADWRMLIFGAILVMMMIFRPQGLLSDRRRRYEFEEAGE